jgi:hydrogenase maturation protease
MTNGLKQIQYQPGEKTLVYGIGNVGRQDDGLGIRLVQRLSDRIKELGKDEALVLESNYQLSIEDALLISTFDVAIFIDASRENPPVAPFSVRQIKYSPEVSFTTHAMNISSIVGLSEELYGRSPRTYLIAVRGYEWEIAENLSPQASVNLDQTFESLTGIFGTPVLESRTSREA